MLPKSRKLIKEEKQARLFQIIIGVLVLGLIIFLVVSDWRIGQKRSKLQNQIRELQGQIQNLEGKNSQLETGISKTGQEGYLEERAREQGYKKPGEEQVVVLPPKEEKKEESQNLWQKIREKIGL